MDVAPLHALLIKRDIAIQEAVRFVPWFELLDDARLMRRLFQDVGGSRSRTRRTGGQLYRLGMPSAEEIRSFQI